LAPEVREAAEPGAAPAAGGYGRGARILSIGIASTGLVTFAYFSVAAHVLSDEDYGAIALLWSILFISLSVMYRPVEQLLARTIAARRARGEHDGHPLRRPLAIQLAFAAVFVALVLGLRGPLEDALGAPALFWVLLAAAVAYAASYFARGVFAGQQWFGLYGGLVFFEAAARVLFPLAVLAGLASGQTAVALGIAAAPLASLLVVPWALRRRAGRGRRPAGPGRRGPHARGRGRALRGRRLGHPALRAGAAQRGGPARPRGAAAGIVFNAFLITRVPLQLFQSVQTSLLPHLAGLEATRAAPRSTARSA
jgi:O-antigen/teichoic acid export membrane protein